MKAKRDRKTKRPRGRPVKYPMPELIPDTPENIMRALVMTPPKREDEWDYVRETGRERNPR